MILLVRLLPKHRPVGSYQSISIITSCARKIITTSTGNYVVVRLAPSIFSCRQTARLWQSGIVNKSIIPTCIGQSNFETMGSFRLFRNQSRLPFDDCKTVEDVLQLAVKHGGNLHPNQNAAMWTYIFRLVSKGQRQKIVHKEDIAQLELLIWDVLEVTMDSLPRMRPRDLTTIILQLAKIANRVSSQHYKRLSAGELALKNVLLDERSSPQHSIFDPLAEAANQILVDFESRQLSNVAYAYSLLGYDPRINDDLTLLEIIANASLDCIQQFNAQSISNMMLAYTKLNVTYEPLFQAMGDAIVMKDDLTNFKPQEIANTVWAYATANIQHPCLFKIVGDEIAVKKDLESFNPQNLANTVWAYATANVQHPSLFDRVGDEIVSMEDLESFDPQNISNIVWAYATADIQHPGLFKKVGDEIVAMDDLTLFNPQNFANTVWSYATANVQHATLFMKVGHEIVAQDNLASFNSQNISNTVWAYATANVHHPDLFEKVGNEIVAMDDLKSFSSQDLVNITWAYATANIKHADFYKKVGDEIAAMDNWELFNSQDLSNIAWAYTVSNIDATSLFSSSFRQELFNLRNKFNDSALSQLYQWHLWQTKEMSNDGLPDTLRVKCKQAFSSADTISSALQKDVVSELRSIGSHPVEEYLTESGYSIDALVEIKGNKVGVEVDGPSHFIGRRPNGPTVLKRRQVQLFDNISLVSVPYWEWNKLGKDRDKKQKYLKALLKFTTVGAV